MRRGGDESTNSTEISVPEIKQAADDDVAKILKMIPGEACAAYTAALALAASPGDPSARYLPVIAFVLCAVLIPLLLRRDGSKYSPPVEPEPTQIVFQLLAFTAWAFSIQNPLAGFGVVIAKWIPALAILFVPLFGGLAMRTAPKSEEPRPA